MKIFEVISEGIHDPAIFKAVFLVGGPGSGKSYIEKKLGLSALGFVSIDSDALLTMLMGKSGLSLKMPPEEQQRRDVVRGKAKMLTKTKRDLGIEGRLGLVVQGTGNDYTKIATLRDQLKALGYDTFIVAVNTNLDTARERNLRRERSVPDEIVVEKWQQAQQNIGKFLNLFNNSAVIDNNGEGAETEPQIQTVYKRIMNWSRQPPQSYIAKKWIAAQTPQPSVQKPIALLPRKGDENEKANSQVSQSLR